MVEGPVCPECGAILCRDKFESMLALEFQYPMVFGAVHHVTVICYNLQHPAAFSEEALAWMRSTLRAIIEEGLTPSELRKWSQKNFRGHVKVLRKVPDKPRSSEWSMTMADVHIDDPETYVNDVMEWAKSILQDIR